MRKVLKRLAEIVQKKLVEVGRLAVWGQCPKEAWDRVEDLTVLVFAFPKSLIRLSSVINVDHDAVPAKHTAVASFQWCSTYCEPPILAVGSSKSADCVVSGPGFEI